MVKVLSLLVVLSLAVAAFGQEAKDAACRSLVKCLSEAEEARGQCDKQRKLDIDNQRKPASSGACSTLGAKAENLQALFGQQRQQHRECLANSFADATPVGDRNKQGECRKAVADYQQQPAAVGANVGAGANSTARHKRQASGHGAANSNVNASVSSTRTGGASSSVGSNTSSSASAAGGAAGAGTTTNRGAAGGGAPSGTPSGGRAPSGPAEAAPGRRIAAGNATKAGVGRNGTANAARAAALAQIRQCYQNAEAKQRICRELYSCCSEVTPCDFKFHLSPLHAQIYQSQLDLFYLRRRCRSQQLQQRGKPGSVIHANATVAASVKGNPGKKPKDN